MVVLLPTYGGVNQHLPRPIVPSSTLDKNLAHVRKALSTHFSRMVHSIFDCLFFVLTEGELPANFATRHSVAPCKAPPFISLVCSMMRHPEDAITPFYNSPVDPLPVNFNSDPFDTFLSDSSTSPIFPSLTGIVTGRMTLEHGAKPHVKASASHVNSFDHKTSPTVAGSRPPTAYLMALLHLDHDHGSVSPRRGHQKWPLEACGVQVPMPWSGRHNGPAAERTMLPSFLPHESSSMVHKAVFPSCQTSTRNFSQFA